MGKYDYLIEEHKQQQIKKAEQEKKQLLIKIKDAIKELSKNFDFKEVYLFGSVLKTKTFYTYSDIDIGFYRLKDCDFFKVSAFLSRYLERDVDIIQMEGHRLEEKIKEEGVVISWNK